MTGVRLRTQRGRAGRSRTWALRCAVLSRSQPAVARFGHHEILSPKISGQGHAKVAVTDITEETLPQCHSRPIPKHGSNSAGLTDEHGRIDSGRRGCAVRLPRPWRRNQPSPARRRCAVGHEGVARYVARPPRSLHAAREFWRERERRIELPCQRPAVDEAELGAPGDQAGGSMHAARVPVNASRPSGGPVGPSSLVPGDFKSGLTAVRKT